MDDQLKPGVDVIDPETALGQLESGRIDQTYRRALTDRQAASDVDWLETYAKDNGLMPDNNDSSIAGGEVAELERPVPVQQNNSPYATPSQRYSGEKVDFWKAASVIAPYAAQYTGKALGRVGSDIYEGLVTDAGSTAAHIPKGAENTANGVLSAGSQIGTWLDEALVKQFGGTVQITDPVTGALDVKILDEPAFRNFLSAGGNTPEVSIPGSAAASGTDTFTGHAVGGMLQFLTSLGMVGKATGGITVGKGAIQTGKRLGQYGLADLAAWDGQEPNLANFIQQYPQLQNPITEFLATNEDTPELTGRLRNAVTGALPNALTEVAVVWLRGMKGARQLKTETDSATVAEAVQKIEAGRAPLPPVERDVVERIAAALKPIDTGVPDDVTLRGVLPDPRLQPLVRGNPESGQVHVNWLAIDTADDVKQVLSRMAEAVPDEIRAAQRGVVSNADTAALAKSENAWKILLGERSGNLPSAHEQYALRQLWTSSGEQLLHTAKLAATGGEAEMFAFRKMMAIHNTIQQQVIGVRTETARALQQWRMPAGSQKLQMDQMKMLLTTHGGSDLTKEFAQKVLLLGDDPAALGRFVRGGFWAKSGSALREYWINALLSGPKTHIVNFMSNSVTLGSSMIERWAAGHIGKMMGSVEGVRVGEGWQMMLGTKEAMKDAFVAAGRVFKTGESRYAQSLGLPGHEISAYSRAISAEAFDIQNSALAKGVDMLGTIINIPGTAMKAGDEFFKILNSRAELYAAAFRQVSEELDRTILPNKMISGVPDKLIKLRVAQMLEEPTEVMRLKAAEFASYNTFQSEPGPIVKKILQLRDSFPPMYILTPFVTTPANILKYTFERTPLALASGRIRADIAAGGVRRDLALARIGLGTIAMTAVYDLALDGHVTAGGPADPNKRKALMRGGWQPYSFRIPTGENEDGQPVYRYVAYNRLDPMGLLFGVAADMADTARNLDMRLEENKKSFEELGAAAVFSVMENMLDKSYLSGLSGFVEALQDPDRNAEFWAQRMAGSLVPALVGEVAKAQDPYMKYTTTLAEKLRSRTPWLSQDIPNRLDMWGEPIEYASGLGEVYDFLSPVKSSSTERATAIDREFVELNYFPPDYIKMPMKGSEEGAETLDINLRDMPEIVNELKAVAAKTPASQLMDENRDAMDKRGGVYKSYGKLLDQLGDRSMKEALNDLVSGRLDDLSLEYAENDQTGKKEMIEGIMGAYRGAARVQVLRNHPELQDMRNRIPSRFTLGDRAPF